MGDEEKGRLLVPLDFHQEIGDGGLNRYVERGDRFIGHHDPRAAREGAGDSDLLGRYHFEAATPGDDSSPGGTNDATLVGDAAITTDPERGDVVSLDGSGDYVEIAGLYGEPASLTLAAWVDFSGTGAAEVISLGDRVILRVDDSLGRGVKASFYNGSGYSQTQSGEYISGTGWHHVAYSFDDAANTQTLYIDGGRHLK